MNLEELRSIQGKERRTDSVQPLRSSFYEDVAAYITDLRAERERIAAERGFDDEEFRRLSDEIEAAEDTVESIYERRVGKVVKAASFAATGMPAEDEGLTEEERALFDQLVSDIERNRTRVLDVLDVDGSAPAGPANASDGGGSRDAGGPGDEASAADSQPQSEASSDPDLDPADLMGTEEPDDDPSPDDGARSVDSPGEPPERTRSPEGDDEEPDPNGAAGDGDDVPRATIRITQELGEILGVDERTYDLARDDVVTLPEANAAPLLERGAAERLE